MSETQAKPRAGLRRKASVQSFQFGLLSYDETYNQTMCYGFVYFEKTVTREEIVKLAEERMISKFPRLRSKLIQEGGYLYFEEKALEDIDMDYHVSYLFSEDEKPTVPQVQARVNPLYGNGFDMEHPLWRAFIVPQLDDGRSLVVFQIDHTIGDGSGLKKIMFEVADKMDMDFIKRLFTRPKKRVMGPAVSKLRLWYNFFYGIFLGLFQILLPQDSPNALKVPDIYNTSKDRKMAAAESIPMDDVKKVKNSLAGVSVNDVAMTVYNLMTQRYLENRGEEAEDKMIRACFPIDLRHPLEKNDHVGNNFSVGAFNLSLEKQTRIEALWKVKDAMNDAKTQPSYLVLTWLSENVVAYLPAKLQLFIMMNMLCKYTGMLSNVMGPPVQIELQGKKVDDMQIYVQSEIGSYFGVFSYNNKLSATVTLAGDREAFPEKLTQHWKTEFEALAKEVEDEKARLGVDVLFPPRKDNFIDSPYGHYFVGFVLALGLAMYAQYAF